MPGIEEFLAAAEGKVFDAARRNKMQHGVRQYNAQVANGMQQFAHLEMARQRAAVVKWKALENLEKNLTDFETVFQRRGGKVVWAQDAMDALNEVMNILSRHNCRMVVKSKSMTTEEINLNETLQQHHIEVTETDLGEYILQIANEKPSHIVAPAMHKSAVEIAKLFSEKHELKADSTPEEITAFVRQHLRKKMNLADAVITGANFVIADTGSVSITENEGNVIGSIASARVHIIIAGIEKVLPSLQELDLFLPLLATHGTGQRITAYNTIVSGPGKMNDGTSLREVYVVLLDNGRTDLLQQQDQRHSLACIRCGACLTACPIYQSVGGHTYNNVYSGPIGAVTAPHTQGVDEYKHLSFASTSCGKCTEVCPVKIDLSRMLLYNRRDFTRATQASRLEKWTYYFWKKAMLRREIMNKGGARAKNFVLQNFFKKSWGSRREMPAIAAKSFNERWREQNQAQ